MPSGGYIALPNKAEADIPDADAGYVNVFSDADDSGAPASKDESGTILPFRGPPGADAPDLTYLDHGNTGSTETIDASAADVHRLVLNAATVTITLAGWPAAGTPAVIRARIIMDATGGRDLVWPGSVDWGDAGEPDWTAIGSNGRITVDLETEDGGSTVDASVAGRAGPAGADGTDGTDGVDGTVGGAISIDYTFSTTTTDSDPGSGNLRLSNATQASAVTIRADLLDAHGVDWSAVLDTLADASNTVKGHIRLFKKSDPTKWLLATVSAVATPSGYRNITIANVGSSGANPLANGDAITLAFSRSGDQGSTVGAGSVTTVEEVDGSPTDSAVTKIVFPNGTLAIAAHVATYTPASTPQVYPHHASMHAIEPPFATTGFATPDLLVNQQWYTGSGAQNDFITFRRLLAAGTWSLALEHYVRTSRGISTISISTDNASWTDLGTIDGYAASPSSGNGIDTRSVLTGLTIPADGLYYIRIKGATKNGASAAYGIAFIGLDMVRTGA